MIKYNLDSLETRRFNYTLIPPPEVKLLTIGDNLILSRSNFALLTGAPKVGKSTFTSVILASAIARHAIFDIQLHCYEDKPRVALFDTEQANTDLYKSVKRVMELSGFRDSLPESLDVYALRQDSCDVIVKIIEFYIQNTPNCGIIIIDGLLDLVVNFNDEKECKKLIDFLKKVTADYGIGIIGILHTGKTTGQSVGHIGSFADRYCQSNLEISKDATNSSINLKGKLLRSSGDFAPISLLRDFDGILFQIDYVDYLQNNKKKKK
jgi:RecA-family ATPase